MSCDGGGEKGGGCAAAFLSPFTHSTLSFRLSEAKEKSVPDSE
jgi:hypothetical protein